MSKARRKNTPVIPTSMVFDIPEFYQQTLSSKRFLCVDAFLKRGKDRIDQRYGVPVLVDDRQINRVLVRRQFPFRRWGRAHHVDRLS